MESIIKPKAPRLNNGWRLLPEVDKRFTIGYEGFAYRHIDSGILIISAVEVVVDKDSIERGPEYHISISKSNQQRCSSSEAGWVLNQLGLEGAEEDNHVPNGFVRNFWRPVAEKLIGIECACKESEPVMKLDKGDFVWRG